MELEEMKIAWEKMSNEISTQKKLTGLLIIKMTESDYRRKTRKVTIPETIGSLGCIVMAVLIAINFQVFHLWYLQACGIIAMVTLVLLAILSLKSIQVISSAHICQNNYKQSLIEYSKRKKRFVAFQKMNFYLGAILLVVILPVTGQLIAGKDVFKQNWIWLWYSTSFILFYFLANWIFKKYVTTIDEARAILQDLED